jgi:uncharacterized protein HemX
VNSQLRKKENATQLAFHIMAIALTVFFLGLGSWNMFQNSKQEMHRTAADAAKTDNEKSRAAAEAATAESLANTVELLKEMLHEKSDAERQLVGIQRQLNDLQDRRRKK